MNTKQIIRYLLTEQHTIFLDNDEEEITRFIKADYSISTTANQAYGSCFITPDGELLQLNSGHVEIISRILRELDISLDELSKEYPDLGVVFSFVQKYGFIRYYEDRRIIVLVLPSRIRFEQLPALKAVLDQDHTYWEIIYGTNGRSYEDLEIALEDGNLLESTTLTEIAELPPTDVWVDELKKVTELVTPSNVYNGSFLYCRMAA